MKALDVVGDVPDVEVHAWPRRGRPPSVYVLADQADAATDSTTGDTIAWGKIVFGALLLVLAARNWRNRPAPGAQPEMPKWMAGIDVLKLGKALGLGLLLAGVNPKNLMLAAAAAAAAGAGLAQLGLSTGDAVGSLIVFVVVGSLTIASPVVSTTCSAAPAPRLRLNEMKNWLALHNDAVMAVLFLVFGVNLIAKGCHLSPETGCPARRSGQ
jgi:hypothetical protein